MEFNSGFKGLTIFRKLFRAVIFLADSKILPESKGVTSVPSLHLSRLL